MIPRNRDGKVLVNFNDPSLYRANTITFLSVIERARRGQSIDIVKPGDFIVILPAMFTGHTDYVSSPFGTIPGGFHLVAVLNSALTNNWLHEIEDPGYFVVGTALLGLLIGFFLSLSISMAVLVLAIISLICSSLLLFSFFGFSVSFPIPALSLLVGGLAGAVIRGHLTSIESYRQSREIAVAGIVQQSFFPKLTANHSDPSSCAVYGRFAPASECGGDWWGTFKKDGYTYIFLGDATGHGIPAALVTSISYAVAKSIQTEIGRSHLPLKPSEILTELNEILCTMESRHSQMTFLVFRIKDDDGHCIYANAGNQPGLLIDPNSALSNGKPKVLTSMGNILGEQSDHKFDDQSLFLEPGSKIILFSDGIFENRDKKEKGQLGKKWLRNTVQEHGMLHGSLFIDTIWKSYTDAIGDTSPDDDATLVVIEYIR